MRDQSQPLSEERVAAWLHGELPPDEHAEVEAAIDREPRWLHVVALLARRETGGAAPLVEKAAPLADKAAPLAEEDDAVVAIVEREHAARLRPGAHVGRYEIEAPLGRGGMGVVYAARDPELGRMVALKLLRSIDPARQERLVIEARALARLADRNVITIYDVGTWQRRVFVAMELLVGPTLLAWRMSAPRAWREIVRIYAQAGRGLVAAHAAGLVHRDFKPANVVVAEDGRVVVLDFGLARLTDEGQDASIADEPIQPAAGQGATQAGAGTPAYMAPEQRRGEPCDAQADQYAYCVALWEALFGQLPGETALPSRGPAVRVPRKVEQIVTRGLAEDPRARHPSMSTLCDALDDALRAKTPWPLVAVGVGGLAIGALLWQRGGDPACSGAAAAMAATFDDARAAEIDTAIRDVDRPWSPRVATEVAAGLRRYADAWITEHTAVCESREALDLQMHCLDRRRRSLAAVVDVLARADVDVAAHAVQTVDALPPVASCRDTAALQATVAPPRDRVAIDALHDRLARAEVLRETTRYDDAMSEARVAIAEAVALGHAPSEADARLTAAWVLVDLGEHEQAETELRAALEVAQAGHHDEAVAIAFHRLAWVVGYKLARHDEGRDLAEHAAAWIERLGHAPYHALARLRALGWIEQDAGRPTEALAWFDAALDVAKTLPEHDRFAAQELALVHNGIGAAAHVAGDNTRASASFTEAAAQLEARLGPDHPDVARVRNNLASVLRDAGKVEAAKTLFVQNLAVFEAAHGPDHPVIGQTLVNLAIAEIDLGQDEAAEQHATRAVEVFTKAHGAAHPLVGKALTIRADARIQLDRPQEAIADLMVALDLETRTLGAEHPSVAIIESNLGGAYYAMDRFEDAAKHQQRSLAILEKTLGAEHPNVGFVLVSLALTRRDQGRLDDALVVLDRAVSQAGPTSLPNALTRKGEVLILLERHADAVAPLERARALQHEIETDPALVGDTSFALAQAWWSVGRKREADAVAAEALAIYETNGQPDNVAAVRAWTRHR